MQTHKNITGSIPKSKLPEPNVNMQNLMRTRRGQVDNGAHKARRGDIIESANIWISRL
jgi:hypothetical protein